MKKYFKDINIIQEILVNEYLINVEDIDKFLDIVKKHKLKLEYIMFYYHQKKDFHVPNFAYGGPLDENDNSYYWAETIYSFFEDDIEKTRNKLKEFLQSKDFKEGMYPAFAIEEK